MNYDVNRNGYWFSKEQLEEHDKQIRTDAIDEVIENIIPTLYEHNVHQVTIDNVKRLLEQLKEQNK